jgi:hypothetical protein
MLTCHRNRPYQFQKCLLTYVTETDHNSSRFVVDIFHRNRPYYCQKFVLTYATEADHKVSRSAWGRMPQKQTKTVPEVYADIPQKQTKQFHKCMLTYITETEHKSPRTSLWDQVVSVVALHINLSLEYHNIYKLVWHLLHLKNTTSAASYQKVNCLINTCKFTQTQYS